MAGDIYIAGRKDIREADRIPLSKILEGTEKGSPVIVLDHQPNAIDEAAKNSVDLQLSGHPQRTAFSFNYIVGLANHTHYGIVEDGVYRAIVSSGLGTWKYPVRTGSPSK